MKRKDILLKATEFAKTRIITKQTDINSFVAESYARDTAIDTAEWLRKELLKEVCQWLDDNYWHSGSREEIIKDFKKDMQLK